MKSQQIVAQPTGNPVRPIFNNTFELNVILATASLGPGR